ncbi:MAG: hypothetical protein LWW77_06005 [Propionibacteriales bacterium]|nr:hypothetical protein [Propionibacteriales bacterium]
MTITTSELRGVTGRTLYFSGAIRDCVLAERNVIATAAGELVPRYEKLEVRTKPGQSLSFYKSGALRTVYLEDQTEVDTPIGPLPAELVSFYEDGSLNTVFQLNGQLSYAWTETDEKSLAVEWTLPFSFDTITAKMISIRFYPGGEVRSLTLWPGEMILLNTPVGRTLARTGVRLHPNGALASFEPSFPLQVETPIGVLTAYDVDAFTVDGDQNSLRFDEHGTLTHLTTAGEVIVETPDRGTVRVGSRTRYALTSDVRVKLPIEISFEGDQVVIDNGQQLDSFSLTECSFTVISDIETSALTACDLRCESGGGDFDADGCSGSCSSGGCGSGDHSTDGCENCVDGQCTSRCA